MLKIGILGCGPIAQFAHLEACQKARNVRLYAICDVAIDLADAMAARYRPDKVYYTYEDMLADPEVDAVIIATADAFHLSAARLAALAGKHILVEKPLGTQLKEALALWELITQQGVCLQVAHMKRFDPGIAFAREFIVSKMGDILAYKGWYADSTHRYTATDALQPQLVRSGQSKKTDKDPKADKITYYMLTHGSHLIDTAVFLSGRIREVKARLVRKFGAFCWFVDTLFENGANGHLDLTVAVRMDWHEGFQIYGEFGSVLGKTFNPWYFKASEVQCFDERTGLFTSPLGADGHVYRRQVEAFADAVSGKVLQVGASIADGIHVMRVMEAIARSVETGKAVPIDQVNA